MSSKIIPIEIETVENWSLELEGTREAVERLAEFASEQASNAAQYKEGMVNNFGRVMELLDEIDAIDAANATNEEPPSTDEVAMWRGLCHSRAVQLNEAYDEIARLRTLLDLEVAHSEDLKDQIDELVNLGGKPT